MSKHTPGPWFMTGELPGYRSRINSTPQNLGWDLAHVCNGPEADANARLIAAAPELLEALQEVFADHDAINRLSWVDRAAAAIAKTGGAE